MRTARRFQWFRRPPLALTWVAVLGMLSVALPLAFGGDDGPTAADRSAHHEEWIRALGDASWQTREIASRRLLEAGRVVIPQLEAHRDDPNPEVRHRVRWLLSVIDPLRHHVVVARFELAGDEGEESRLTEWARFELDDGASEARFTTGRGGQETRVFLSVRPAEPRSDASAEEASESPTTLEIEIGENSTGSQLLKPVGAGVFVLREEETLALDSRRGMLEGSMTAACWLVGYHSRRGPGSASTPGASVDDRALRVERELEELLRAPSRSGSGGEARQGWSAAAAWRRLDLLPPLPPESPDPRLAHARLRAGEASGSSAAALRSWWEKQLQQGGPGGASAAAFHEYALVLASLGHRDAVDQLLEQLPVLPLWSAYRAVKILRGRVLDPATPAEERKRIAVRLCEPELFRSLPWASGLIPLLVQDLQDALPPPDFRDAILPLFRDGFDLNTPSAYWQIHTQLKAIRRLRDQGGLDLESWKEPVMELLLESRYLESALMLLRRSWLEGELPAEEWWKLLSDLTETTGEPSNTALQTTDRLLEGLVNLPSLTAEDRRRAWSLRLQHYAEASGYLRNRIEAGLVKVIGDLDEPKPTRNEPPLWKERGVLWQEKLAETPESSFAAAGSPGRRLVTEIHVRVDEDRSLSEVVRFDSRFLELGSSVPGETLEGRDDTVILEEDTRGRNEAYLLSGRRLTLGVPTVMPSSQDRFSEYLIASGTPSATAPPQRSSVRYWSLYLLEGADATPMDTASWQARLVDELTSESDAGRRQWISAVGKLRLRSVLPELRRLYAQNQDRELACALLRLGDLGPRDEFLAGLDPQRLRFEIEIVEELIRLGDEATAAVLLEWLETPESHPQAKPWLRRLLRSLSPPLRSGKLRSALDPARWTPVLIAALDERSLQSDALQILYDLTQIDFGHEEWRRSTGALRRTQETALVEAWKEWWESRSTSHPKPR